MLEGDIQNTWFYKMELVAGEQHGTLSAVRRYYLPLSRIVTQYSVTLNRCNIQNSSLTLATPNREVVS